jgi:hypothetical protein
LQAALKLTPFALLGVNVIAEQVEAYLFPLSASSEYALGDDESHALY